MPRPQRFMVSFIVIVLYPLSAAISAPPEAEPTDRQEPNSGRESGDAKELCQLIAGLKKTERTIVNLSVTTEYIKRQIFLLPVQEPVRMSLITKAIVARDGRQWNDCLGEQVNIEADGKTVRLYRAHTRGAFDGKVARQLKGRGDGRFESGSVADVLSWHGVNLLEFTTHYFGSPVSELLKVRGAKIVKHDQWDMRPVVILDTTPRGMDSKRKYRFWIDPERKIVVRRAILIQFQPDQKYQEYMRIESQGHREIEPGIWLPDRVKYESVEVTADLKPEKLSWGYEGKNTDWKVNQDLPEETFVLSFPDNIRVEDHRDQDPKKKTGEKSQPEPPEDYSVWLARWNAEQKAIAEIEKLGGIVQTETCAPELLRKRLGPERSKLVTVVNMMPSRETSAAAFQHVRQFSQLKKLFLNAAQATKITDEGFGHLRKITKLKYLHCSYSGITDNALAQLSALKYLTALDLPGSRLTDAGLRHVREMTGLKVLNVGGGPVGGITDSGLKNLRGLTQLESLNLGNTSVTDTGMEHLENLDNLKVLWLSNTRVTEIGASTLKDANPDVEIKGLPELGLP